MTIALAIASLITSFLAGYILGRRASLKQDNQLLYEFSEIVKKEHSSHLDDLTPEMETELRNDIREGRTTLN